MNNPKSDCIANYNPMKKRLNCILLIDDDSSDNFIHKMIIKNMDIADHIDVALNGEEGLKYLLRDNTPVPEIIFLDINMPKMNGWEFMEEYKKLDESRRSKIVIGMLTTSFNPDDKSKSKFTTDIESFNNKPLTEEMLSQIIDKHFPYLKEKV